MIKFALFIVVMLFSAAYISLILWVDAGYGQYVHNIAFPEDKEVNKQDETDNQKEE